MADRSRFEKWYTTHAFDLERDPIGSRDCQIAWKSWRAALEDRQEAAPMKEGLKDLSVRLLRRFAECQPPYDHDNECSFCGVKEGEPHWHTCSWLTARTIFGIGPGVPSEATPSKEICYWCHGLPVNFRLATDEGLRPICDTCNGIALHRGQAALVKFPAPAPEGAQGKEPHDFLCAECDSHCCITAGGSKLICYHCHLAKVERAIGEAAGRRSAITELQEWATVDREKVISGMIDFYRLKAKCAELQEKTK